MGDTCDPSAIIPLAAHADVLIHEATHINENYPIAIEKGHSTAGMAGSFAERIKCKTLILNHFSPREDRRKEYVSDKLYTIDRIVSQAQKEFKGNVIAANVN